MINRMRHRNNFGAYTETKERNMTSTLLSYRPIIRTLSDYIPTIRAAMRVSKGWGSIHSDELPGAIQSEEQSKCAYPRFNMDKSAQTRVEGEGARD